VSKYQTPTPEDINTGGHSLEGKNSLYFPLGEGGLRGIYENRG